MQPHDYLRIIDTCPNADSFDVCELVMNDDVHAFGDPAHDIIIVS